MSKSGERLAVNVTVLDLCQVSVPTVSGLLEIDAMSGLLDIQYTSGLMSTSPLCGSGDGGNGRSGGRRD